MAKVIGYCPVDRQCGQVKGQLCQILLGPVKVDWRSYQGLAGYSVIIGHRIINDRAAWEYHGIAREIGSLRDIHIASNDKIRSCRRYGQRIAYPVARISGIASNGYPSLRIYERLGVIAKQKYVKAICYPEIDTGHPVIPSISIVFSPIRHTLDTYAYSLLFRHKRQYLYEKKGGGR